MSDVNFLDLPQSSLREADVLLLPLPFEGTVSFGQGTEHGPHAIWKASAQIELWDEELDFDLESLQYHSVAPLAPTDVQSAATYLRRVELAARDLHQHDGLLVGVGGEHSLTPGLVSACYEPDHDLTGLTVVQFDAHCDLRAEFEGTPQSHACAMRPLVERGARVIAIGIRSAEREEFEFGRESGRVTTYFAQQLDADAEVRQQLIDELRGLTGDVYLTFDIDALEVSLCPGTGTPQPGGLQWWPTLRYLRALLHENDDCRLVGCDVVETAPLPRTHVNEFTAAKLLAKMIAYYFAG